MSNQQKKSDALNNILYNIVIPVVVLTFLSKKSYLGPTYALIVALSFPIGLGFYEYIKTKKINTMSIIGLVSVFLTGIFGVLELPAEWIAYKEAGVPLLIGLVFLISNFTKKPLVQTFLLDSGMFDKEKLHTALDLHQNKPKFYKTLTKVSYLMVLTFIVSAILNYGLAKYLLVSKPGTEEYVAELGKMQGLSFPVIALPSMLMMAGILWFLFRSIKNLSGLSMEEVMVKQ